ncbi:MAG: hypothetical protein H6742_18390 [Alphaproteobacteria bacterium]|nr:hypothetical protein [Alphaproteobacteria bacterium]
MGFFAWFALIMAFAAAMKVLYERLFGVTQDTDNSDPTSCGEPMGEGAERFGSAMKGLNTSLPFLGGQSGWVVVPPTEGSVFDDYESPHQEFVEVPEGEFSVQVPQPGRDTPEDGSDA